MTAGETQIDQVRREVAQLRKEINEFRLFVTILIVHLERTAPPLVPEEVRSLLGPTKEILELTRKGGESRDFGSILNRLAERPALVREWLSGSGVAHESLTDDTVSEITARARDLYRHGGYDEQGALGYLKDAVAELSRSGS